MSARDGASTGPAESRRVVTLSAGYGAGGAVIGPMLADRLGAAFADRLVPLRDLRRHRSDESAEGEEIAEEPASGTMEGLALLSTAWNIPQPGDADDLPEHVREHIEASIAALVEQGPAVILGRAACVSLSGRAGAFHVRLDGPPERRAARGALWEGISIDEARRHLHETDATRDRYVRRLYGRHVDDESLYHLEVDTTAISFDAAVDLIARAAQAFWIYDESRLAEEIATARAEAAARLGPQP